MRVAELALFERGNVYILEQDYLALQAALREALDGWLNYAQGLDAEDRITELRKFLDDK